MPRRLGMGRGENAGKMGGGEENAACAGGPEGNHLISACERGQGQENGLELRSRVAGGSGLAGNRRMVMQKRNGKNRAARGFSLLELMLVLAIMGILMAVAAYNVVGGGNRARVRATEASLTTIKTALIDYQLGESGSYPPDLRTLVTTKRLDDKALTDAWKNAFQYDPKGRDAEHGFYLFSTGPDGKPGTEDDIDIWGLNAGK